MKAFICKWLLAALNSRWLGRYPGSEYAFVNNIDAFSRSYLNEHRGMTVDDVLDAEFEPATRWNV